uniref:C-type lectin domain-containing protein n=1 Tax=Sinocyclocheilus rhinocerous TaxID=307959 RepID=A0A673KXC8_9TELE
MSHLKAFCFGFLFVSGFTVLLLRCSGPDWFEFGEFCYKPFEEKKTWHSARTAYDCLARGADLVSIHSPEEEIFLSSYSKGKSKWIGLSVNPVEGGSSARWCFTDHENRLYHTNWGHGEPNNHNGRENCVEMVTTENGTSWWNDLNCDQIAKQHAENNLCMWGQNKFIYWRCLFINVFFFSS